MRTPARLLTLALALPLVPGAAWLLAGSSPPAAPPQEDLRVRTGTLEAWELLEDGTIYVVLRSRIGEDENEQEYAMADGGFGTTWYRSPPRQTVQNNFEEMLLQVILESREENSPLAVLTIAGDEQPTSDGRARDRAMQIKMVRQP